MIAVCILIMTSMASAAPGLAWAWKPGEPVRYHMETLIDSPGGYMWRAEDETWARTSRSVIIVEVTCEAQLVGKLWQVDCILDEVALRGAAIPGEEVTLTPILAANEARLKGKTVRFRMGPEGRIRKFELIGFDTRNSKLGSIIDGLRQQLRRSFTPLDLQLPKKGDDRGKKWSQKGSPLVFELMGNQGTAGGFQLKHRVERRSSYRALIHTDGYATVSAGINMEAGPSSLLRITATGRTQFDTNTGLVDWAEVTTRSAYGTSNFDALSGVGPTSFSGWLGRIDAEGNHLQPQP